MNTFGRKFRVSIFGESHGELIGVVLDGVPAGLELAEEDFTQDILSRKSGAKGKHLALRLMLLRLSVEFSRDIRPVLL